LHGLRGLYGDDKAQFKSEEQSEAVRSALERKRDLLVILSTEEGMSVVFMALAWMETGLTTVVIVPFVGLIGEIQERCSGKGIGCCIWRNNNVTLSQRMAQIVLVGVENAVTPEFRQFLIRSEQGESLARIVIDECHVLLTQRDFRPVMRRVTSTVKCVRVPVVPLTATMPTPYWSPGFARKSVPYVWRPTPDRHCGLIFSRAIHHQNLGIDVQIQPGGRLTGAAGAAALGSAGLGMLFHGHPARAAV
jgi:hypothetical protein